MRFLSEPECLKYLLENSERLLFFNHTVLVTYFMTGLQVRYSLIEEERTSIAEISDSIKCAQNVSAAIVALKKRPDYFGCSGFNSYLEKQICELFSLRYPLSGSYYNFLSSACDSFSEAANLLLRITERFLKENPQFVNMSPPKKTEEPFDMHAFVIRKKLMMERDEGLYCQLASFIHGVVFGLDTLGPDLRVEYSIPDFEKWLQQKDEDDRPWRRIVWGRWVDERESCNTFFELYEKFYEETKKFSKNV